ncbi:EAL domain-containing protein [Massilia sp. NEAU-DD11]|uniref:EAL domain-containing protein n=1 Tax=Massilia cellulosiltytica TaxID=2683234 RepID=A0A7X3KB02_9BURK|nr:EAL domain-containing protein [Telluria cellulosilytica]MVW63586.1 EAL domain-containing protein [Telluria cellulosilytica]
MLKDKDFKANGGGCDHTIANSYANIEAAFCRKKRDLQKHGGSINLEPDSSRDGGRLPACICKQLIRNIMIQPSDAGFSALFHAHPVPMWVYDLETFRFVAVNAAAIVHYGYSEAEFLAMTLRDIRLREDLERLDDNLRQPQVPSIEKSGIWRHVRKDGAVIHVEITSHPLWFGERACRFVLAHDVTERLLAQDKIMRLSRIYAVSSGVNAAIARIHTRDALFDEVCRIAVHVGAFKTAWIGAFEPDVLEGRVVAWCGGERHYVDRVRLTLRADSIDSARPACVAAREARAVICNDVATDPGLAPLAREMLEEGQRAVAALPLAPAGRVDAVMVFIADTAGFFDAEELKLLDDLVGDINFALQFIDNKERLSYLAYYDVLTGLPNARLFEDRLGQFIHSAQAGQDVGTILVNIDRFTQLNDAFGRHMGDALLKQVAQRLDEALPGGVSVARIGGATFAIAVAELAQDADLEHIVDEFILATINQHFRLGPHEARVQARAGLALFPRDGSDAETLLKHAEAALQSAKRLGEPYLYYSPAMNASHAARLALESELLHALDAQEFVVYYQPRVDLVSGRIVSAEALIRWRHPQRGLVFPGTFIPLAEEVGLIEPISDWVLDAVCAQQARWLQGKIDVVPVAVNLSAAQLRNGKFVQDVTDALSRHRLPAHHIEFELTESMVMNDVELAAANLQALKALGIQLSLDDFGTGHSSLAHLQRFPFDAVKIDRAFIRDVNANAGNAAIATAVIAMAHSLHLRVVAEGVETEGQLQFLRRRRCDELQGFYFSEAVPAAQFETMLVEKPLLTLGPQVDEDTLLIVDDEPNNLSTLRRLLRREGYRVLTASGGQEGLNLLALNKVQVIISDQRMPNMSGTQFMRVVRELYPDTIRIVLSGFTDLAAVTDSVNQGELFKFMTKPWDDGELVRNIRDAFRLHRQRNG